MGFLKKLASFFTSSGETNAHFEYVQCARCGEKIRVRVDLRNELTRDYESSEGAYHVHKGVMGTGDNYCFQMIDIDLYFNADRDLVSRYISNGEFITKEAFESAESEAHNTPTD